MVTGSCLCGGIQYQVSGLLNKIQICHCQQCRKAQGSAFAANLPVNVAEFTITKGRELLREFESQTREGKYRVFCCCCGSAIISRLDSAPDVVRLRAGTLDEPIDSEVTLHQFVAHKAGWWDINDSLPQHDEYPPK